MEAKQHVPSFLENISAKHWTRLWRIQYAYTPDDHQRVSKLNVLLADMRLVGHNTTRKADVLQLEEIFHASDEDSVLRQWDVELRRLRKIDRTRPEYIDRLELGIRIFSSAHMPERAEDLCLELLQRQESCNPWSIIQIIELLSSMCDPVHSRLAWNYYRIIHESMRSLMGIEEYRAILAAFYNAGLAYLVPRVLSDLRFLPVRDRRLLDRLYFAYVLRLQTSCNTPRELNQVCLMALRLVPPNLQTRRFYLTWVEQLVRLDGNAYLPQVVELMYERGRRPDAKILNSLLQTWTSSLENTMTNRAEGLAWEMIEKRLNEAVAPSESQLTNLRSNNRQLQRIPGFIERVLPAATPETFACIILHYARTGNIDDARHVKNLLNAASFSPSRAFAHILIYMEINVGSHEDVWSTFLRTTETVEPDMHTFFLLWTNMLLYIDRRVTAIRRGFPNPRELFAQMLAWYDQLPSEEAEKARIASVRSYVRIVTSFTRFGDLMGTLLALHVLRQRFGLTPNRRVVNLCVRLVARKTARRDPVDSSQRQQHLQHNVGLAEELLIELYLNDIGTSTPASRNAHNSDLYANITDLPGERLFHVLDTFLRYVLQHSMPPDQLAKSFVLAREAMGLGVEQAGS